MVLEIKDLIKDYYHKEKKIEVLKSLSYNFEKGKFYGIMGHSGSGKTTLFNIIGTIDKEYNGNILVNSKNISSLNDEDMASLRNLEIGFVFQAFNLENTQTALENVMMPLIFSGSSKKNRKSKAGKALELVELGHLKNHKPNEMSGGQRQRVSIARALVNDPKIIFADEPTGNLDSKTGENIMNLFKDLNNQGYTIIMVTHNMEEAEKAKRVVRIKDGNIISDSLNV